MRTRTRRRPARRRAPALLGAATFATLVLGACATTAAGPPAVTSADVERRVVTVADAPATASVVEATERLGLTMLDAAPREGNVVVSPASAVVALSMLAEGARGETAASLDAALGASGQDRTDAVNALLAALQDYDGDPALVQKDELPKKPLVHVANQVVLDDQAQVHDTYLEALAAGYDAGVLETDLGSEPGLEPLDRWVRHHTGGLIEESAVEPDVDSRLALQNAALLAARWSSPFEEQATRPSPFVLADGTEVDAEAMHQEHDWSYAEVGGWQAVRLPYTEGFHADVVLPPDGTDPATLAPEKSAALREALDAAPRRSVALTLPTLDVDAEAPLDLEPALAAAGLGDLLVEPDLTGISDEPDLKVTQAWQQAVLRVDEDGTVAAAVTEIVAGVESAPMIEDVVELRVDRPYVFSVSHSDTRWPLFTAAIRDPRH
ncbi:serpin family protein [Cellulosimicrobium cellulans]|uniref:serpin family protein n=1 Tax=Cellulosimicrobium cellulans TaxID=1710 RepID=UPI001EDAA0DE|nr:serpin family protein [Cellulosimicrobium cellulans]UKJ65997.1 serpin family protein [Cellulosimicrobium cellulans]